jgi:hypothetical protein
MGPLYMKRRDEMSTELCTVMVFVTVSLRTFTSYFVHIGTAVNGNGKE